MSATRRIEWEGIYNARDLGGLPVGQGGTTRFGAFIRSGDLRFVTEAGWRTAFEAGLRTIVDLRNDDEIRPAGDHRPTSLSGPGQSAATAAGAPNPPGIARIEVPLDGIEDADFWREMNGERLNGTPLYYQPFLSRKPDRCAALISVLAGTEPGGVLFHCGAGRDRTGLATLLLLSLAGVEPEAIADDYEMSIDGVQALLAKAGRADDGAGGALSARGTTARGAVLEVLDGFDAHAYLIEAGVPATDLDELRGRLVP